MDHNEKLCAALLRNAEINPRIPLDKLNEYKKKCENYGYNEKFDIIINNRSQINTSPKISSQINTNPKILLPTPSKISSQVNTSPKILLPTPSKISSQVNTSPKILPQTTPKTSSLVVTSNILLPTTSPIKLTKSEENIDDERNESILRLLISFETLLPIDKNISKEKLKVDLPKPLWNWKVEENQPPIPIKYPVTRKFDILAIEEWRRTIAELSLINPNLTTLNVNQLTRLFILYNTFYFNNSLPATKLVISDGLTVTAGKCKIDRTSQNCVYTITISRSIFTKLNLENNQGTKSGGLVCKSRLNCLQLVLEHEIIHLIAGHYFPNRKQLDKKIYSSHGLLFKGLVYNYFGQTESTHQIGNIIYDDSDKQRTLTKDEIKAGTLTFITDKKGIKKGVIINIYNKNVGVDFIDGDSWKVGADFLHKISEEDDDYELLLDLKKELASKLKIYNNIKIGDTVKFYYETKDNVLTGKVSKLNNKSSKLSIVVGTSTYTIVYSRLIGITKTTEPIKDNTDKKYTISDFKIGDKVIIAGGPRSSPVYGSIIKLNRVNAQIQSNNSSTIWNAPYHMLSFQ